MLPASRHAPWLPGRVVVVTGATSGIGRATAHALAAVGARLVLTARSADSLEDVRAECEAAGASVATVAADVRDAQAVAGVLQVARERYGAVDALVHSAGVLAYGKFEDIPADVFGAVLDTTLGGTVNEAREALRLFREQGHGRLVVVGSVLGKMVAPYLSAYVTAKWGLLGFVRTLQVETREHPDIDVVMVSPGSVDTPAYTQAGTYLGRHGRPPPPVVSAEAVAAKVVAALERPRREISVGSVNWVMVTGFRLLPAVFDTAVLPLMRVGGLSREHGVPVTSGNVLHPVPQGNAVSGSWSSHRPLGRSKMARSDTEKPPVIRQVAAPAGAVWDVLADGWLYATWVVGASRVRAVDPQWPAAGSRLHHSVGLWPFLLSDYTTVEEATPPTRLVLMARGWPLGEARVVLELIDHGPDRCAVSMGEDAAAGPGRGLVPWSVRQMLIRPRNVEALRRLGLLAEGRHRQQRQQGEASQSS